ncbi:hypothetical protein [Blastopirellula retiformator]|nr:hypothetical protein [Blastopirellula retiformator]
MTFLRNGLALWRLWGVGDSGAGAGADIGFPRVETGFPLATPPYFPLI